MSLAFKEGIKIPPPALNEIILASNQDVRQVKKTNFKIHTEVTTLLATLSPVRLCFVSR